VRRAKARATRNQRGQQPRWTALWTRARESARPAPRHDERGQWTEDDWRRPGTVRMGQM